MNDKEGIKSKRKLIILYIIVIAIILLLTVVVFIYSNLNNTKVSKDNQISDNNKSNNLDIVKNVLELYTEDIGQVTNLKFETNYKDTYRFTQTYKGIEVYGGGVIATIKNGEVLNIINHNYKIPDSFNTEPKNSKEDLLVVAKEYLKNNDISPIDNYLIIYPISDNEFTLAYLFDFNISKVIVSDSDKTILSASETFNTNNIENTSISQKSTQQDNVVENDKTISEEEIKQFLNNDGKYLLLDDTRNIQVYRIKDDYKTIKSNEFLQENTDYYSNIIWDDAHTANTNQDIFQSIKAMQNLQLVYDYYKKEFDFKSIKGNEEYKLNVFTNFSTVENLDFTNNATLAYFNKDDIRIYLGAANLYNEQIEVMAHEYTHGYFNCIVEKYDDAETNAINEAYCDIMGMIIEAYYEGTEIDGIYGECYKDMERNIKDSNTTYRENIRVTDSHESSIIVSKVAYLMSINEKLDLTTKDLSKLWFNSLYKLPKNIVIYDDVERAILLEAIELGYSKEQIREIANIFVSLGYPDYYEECINKKILNTKTNVTLSLDQQQAITLLEKKIRRLERCKKRI